MLPTHSTDGKTEAPRSTGKGPGPGFPHPEHSVQCPSGPLEGLAPWAGHLCACATLPASQANSSPWWTDLGRGRVASGNVWLLTPSITRWAWPHSVFERPAPGPAVGSMGWDVDPAGKAVRLQGSEAALWVPVPAVRGQPRTGTVRGRGKAGQ